MQITPRRLVVLNTLTLLACVLHIAVHAAGLAIGEWHDYAVYALVGVSFAGSVVHLRQSRAALPAV